MLKMRWWVYEQGWQTKQKSWCAHTRSRGINFSMTFIGALALGWSWILVHSIHHDGEEQNKCDIQSRRDVTGRVTSRTTFGHFYFGTTEATTASRLNSRIKRGTHKTIFISLMTPVALFFPLPPPHKSLTISGSELHTLSPSDTSNVQTTTGSNVS